jgi:hypothetical protein
MKKSYGTIDVRKSLPQLEPVASRRKACSCFEVGTMDEIAAEISFSHTLQLFHLSGDKNGMA